MQLTTIRTEVRQRLGVSPTDPALPNAVLLSFINAGIRTINLMHDWPWLVTVDATLTATVAGQTNYTPASNHRKTLYLQVGDGGPLTYKTEQDLVRYDHYVGHPRYYTIENGSIRLAPQPDAIYPIRHLYIAVPAALASDTDEPTIPDWAIDALISYVTMLAAGKLKDSEMQKIMEREWNRAFVALRDEIRRSKGNPMPMHRTDVFWSRS